MTTSDNRFWEDFTYRAIEESIEHAQIVADDEQDPSTAPDPEFAGMGHADVAAALDDYWTDYYEWQAQQEALYYTM